MPGTGASAGHTLVNITKISALVDSIILSNGTLCPLKTMWKGNKIVNKTIISHFHMKGS